MAVVIGTLNVNGLNADNKKYYLLSYLMQYKIDILFIQEHNLKENYNLEIIATKYEAYINTSLLQKGGTGILIWKNNGIKVVKY